MKSILKIITVFAFILIGCKSKDISKTNVISSYYSYEIECVAKNLDGSLVVKTWGSGINIESAVLNARTKVIDDIIFKGIKKGALNCNTDPLVSNPNLKEEHKSFFEKFYSKRGNFGKFVSRPDANWYSNLKKDKIKFSVQKSYELLTTIDVVGLKEYLSENKIIL